MSAADRSMPPPVVSFASDNAAGVLPEVMDAIVAANVGPALAYGDDPWTERASALVGEVLGEPGAEVAFCWGGTGANLVGLQCLLRPWEAVICPDTAHINVDECGAPERFTGCKLLALPTSDGKLRPDQVEPLLHVVGDQHHAQPRVRQHHPVDGVGHPLPPGRGRRPGRGRPRPRPVPAPRRRSARQRRRRPRGRRAVVHHRGRGRRAHLRGHQGRCDVRRGRRLPPAGLGDRVRFVRKQAAQLPSKMRFVAAQFEALLTDGLWVRAAEHANGLAALLAHRLAGREGVEVTRPPEVNSVFLRLPSAAAVAELQQWSFVWDWDVPTHEVRAMTSFATTAEDVERFAVGRGGHRRPPRLTPRPVRVIRRGSGERGPPTVRPPRAGRRPVPAGPPGRRGPRTGPRWAGPRRSTTAGVRPRVGRSR